MDEVSGEVGQVGQVEAAAGAEVHLKHLRTAKVLRLYVCLSCQPQVKCHFWNLEGVKAR